MVNLKRLKKRYRSEQMKDILIKQILKQGSATPLSVRAFARELQGAILGRTFDEPKHSRIEKRFEEITGSPLEKGTWGKWWNQGAMPKTLYNKLQEHFPELHKKWLSPEISNRLRLFVSALDAQSEADQEISLELSNDILNSIHSDWFPHNNGTISIPASVELYKSNSWHNDRREVSPAATFIPKGLGKNNLLAIGNKASYNARQQYEVINPSSILPFLLSYAVETELNGNDLKQAFVFDLMSSVMSLLTIMFIEGNGDIFQSGKTASLAYSCYEFFVAEELDNEDDNSFNLWEVFYGQLTPLILEFSPAYNTLNGEKRAQKLAKITVLFFELRHLFHISLQISGLYRHEIIAIVNNRLKQGL